ncbi:hypothetical protein MAR_038074 [Mya arenaria]|uniref:Uncharacterized protein n=1 Tax=Mya arenaria TaxID=6604 RepID=A0ABY7FQV3_MYAAR|nr:hypothetical protein MAR_038074 [Mya arenaria]
MARLVGRFDAQDICVLIPKVKAISEGQCGLFSNTSYPGHNTVRFTAEVRSLWGPYYGITFPNTFMKALILKPDTLSNGFNGFEKLRHWQEFALTTDFLFLTQNACTTTQATSLGSWIVSMKRTFDPYIMTFGIVTVLGSFQTEMKLHSVWMYWN